MKRIIPVFAVLLLGGCTATSPQYIAQRQSAVLASAEATCSKKMSPSDTARDYFACLRSTVHSSGYWGQGVLVVAANDGSPRIVEAPDRSGLLLDNVNGIALPSPR